VFGREASKDLEAPADRIESYFEGEPGHLEAGIVVRNLRKVFKSLTGGGPVL
jgi:hypothetical protein